MRHWVLLVGVSAVAFLVGAAWQFGRAQRLAQERSAVQRTLVAVRAEAALQAAILQLQDGDTEGARQEASSFFTTLQRDVVATVPDRDTELRLLLANRDSVITALARADPASMQLLRSLLQRFQTLAVAPLDSVR